MLFIILAIGIEMAAVVVLLLLARMRGRHRLIMPGAFIICLASACSVGLAMEFMLNIILLGSRVTLLVPLGWLLVGLGGFAIVARMRPPLWLAAAPVVLVAPTLLYSMLGVAPTIVLMALATGWLVWGLVCWRLWARSRREKPDDVRQPRHLDLAAASLPSTDC